MIFASLGLLVVAVILIIVGIAKSAVAPLVISVICTVTAGALLYGSFLYYRRKAVAGEPGGEGRAEPRYPGSYAPPGTASGAGPVGATGPAGQTTVPAGPTGVPAPAYTVPPGYVAATAGAGNGGVSLPEGWHDLNAEDAIAVVETLSLPELHEARRVEVEGKHRKRVLTAVDKRTERILAVRRSTTKR